VILLLTAGCAGGTVPEASGNPAASGVEEQDAGDSGGTEFSLEATFLLDMSAHVNGLVADMAYDQLESDWVGEFSTDSEGLFTGVGNVTYDALVFAVDEELCGYSWTELGEVAFNISGKVRDEGGQVSYPVKFFLLDVKVNSLSEPEPTCDDPPGYLSNFPSQYIEIHRNALLSTVLTHLHQNVGNQIQLGQDLAVTSGTVDYWIQLSLAAEDLD
jgi:hypothetical protein